MGLSGTRNTVDFYRAGPWFDEIPPPSSTIHEDVLPPLRSTRLQSQQHRFLCGKTMATWSASSGSRHSDDSIHGKTLATWCASSGSRHSDDSIYGKTLAIWHTFILRILHRSVGDPIRCILRLLFRPQRLHSFGKTLRQTIRPLGTCETISIGSSSGDVDSFGEKL